MIKDSETIGGLIARWWSENGHSRKDVGYPIVLSNRSGDYRFMLSIDEALQLALRLADMIEEADNERK